MAFTMWAGTRRVAYYTNISPGAYTFRVMAANNDGVWSTRDATIPITVVPPFWRTRWFVTLAALGLAAASFLLYRRRIGQLERARRAQEEFSRQLIESQEGERKRIAGELHDSLGQNLVVIKNRAWLSLQEPDNHRNVIEQMEEKKKEAKAGEKGKDSTLLPRSVSGRGRGEGLFHRLLTSRCSIRGPA